MESRIDEKIQDETKKRAVDLFNEEWAKYIREMNELDAEMGLLGRIFIGRLSKHLEGDKSLAALFFILGYDKAVMDKGIK